MTISVWAPLALPLLLAPLLLLPSVRSLPDRLAPRTAVWLLTATSAGLAGAGAVALGLLSLAALLRLPFFAAMGHLQVPVARQLAPPVVVPAGAVAGVLLVAVGLRAAHVLYRYRQQYAGARRLVDGHGTGGDLVVLPDARPDAYALPRGLRQRGSGRPGPEQHGPGQVVVTAGMLKALPADEREVLLAHERAHLSGRHHLFVLLADLATALHPLLRPLRDGVAYSIERWADETAATRVGDRRLVARAIGRAALAGRTHQEHANSNGNGNGNGDGDAANGRVGMALGMAAGPVPRRVAALLGPDPAAVPQRDLRRPVLAAVLLASVLALSSGTALHAAADLHQQVEAGQLYSLTHGGEHGAQHSGRHGHERGHQYR